MEDKAYSHIFYDILENVLQLSENPSQFAEYLTQQIRELIGARTILIATKNEENKPQIFSVFPQRKKEWCQTPEMLHLAELSFTYNKIIYLEIENVDEETKSILEFLQLEKTIAIPLIAAKRKVGSILLLDIMDLYGIDSVIDLLTRLSGVLALIIRNSLLYHNLEQLVDVRTKELKIRNEILEEREKELKAANEEFETLNEELVENMRKTGEINLQLRNAKNRAERSESQTKDILLTAMDGFWILDFQRNFIEVNDVACKMLGYTREELCEMNIADIEAYESPEQIEIHFKKVVETGEDRFESKHCCKNGNIIDVEISVKNQPGQNLLVAFVHDISNRKQAEKDLIAAKEKAEESERLKTAFLQNMSHELRTPLNAIFGFSGLLDKPEMTSEKRSGYIKIIQNSSHQLLSIVSDILTISAIDTKQEKVNISKVCVNNIIVELLAILKTQAFNQNLNLYSKQQLNDKQSEIYTDKTKLTQILTNLLTNALKFTHQGIIEFGYELVETGNTLYLQFYVNDTGIGIAIEQQEKIFERFRQADISIGQKYGGTGLGLSISKGFVDLLGGAIWVKSELGKGSTFYFSIPYKPVNEIDAREIVVGLPANRGTTILVAEDEEYNFLLIEEVLSDMNLTLIHTKNGVETVDVCKSDTPIDLILMDIKMPIMNGHTAAGIIKEIRPDLPIIAQSAYALENEIAKYIGIFDDYITKPLDQFELIRKVKKYIYFQE